MKAHYLTAKERKAAKAAAQTVVDHELADLSARVMLLWCKAMKDAGYKAKSINNVIDHLPDSMTMYEHYRAYYDNAPAAERTEDLRVADWSFFNELREYGVNVRMTQDEM